jgi:hypothetical protein
MFYRSVTLTGKAEAASLAGFFKHFLSPPIRGAIHAP